MATGQHMPGVARSPTSADPDGTDLSQPDGSYRVVSMRTPDGPAWDGVRSGDAFLHLDVDYCSYVHYTSLSGSRRRAFDQGGGPRAGRSRSPGWPAHAAAPASHTR